MAEEKEWFVTWFDTEYYHILYQNRDDREAELFISTLMNELKFPQRAKILDLACGKGRHSIYLNSLGYDVTGVDLSSESISTAQEQENESLRFFTHDMREPITGMKFDLVLNLFTSFGYFDNPDDNLKVLQSIRSYLKEEGRLVIDFMNVHRVIQNLVASETREFKGIEFQITRKVQAGHIIKTIEVDDQGKKSVFSEKVQALTLEDFEEMLEKTGFHLISTAGNYNLDNYSKSDSDRLILFAEITR